MAYGPLYASTTSDGVTVQFPCGPCGGIAGCCLYPYDGDPPQYPSSDLPASILGIFADASTATFSLTSPYTYTDGSGHTIFQLSSPDNFWDFSNLSGVEPSPSHCLITKPGSPNAYGVSDFFPDTVSDGIDPLVRNPEVNLCAWYDDNGIDPPTAKQLHYDPTGTVLADSLGNSVTLMKPKWVYSTLFSGLAIWIKNDPQDGPLGTYVNIDGVTPDVTIT